MAASLVALIVASALAACSPRSETPQEPADTAAAAPSSKADDVHTFTIGDFSAISLRDGALEFPNDNKVFGVGRTSAEVAALLTGADLPTDHLDLSIQPLLVKTADRVLLFDTGAGANMGSSGGRLLGYAQVPSLMALIAVQKSAANPLTVLPGRGDWGLVSGQRR